MGGGEDVAENGLRGGFGGGGGTGKGKLEVGWELLVGTSGSTFGFAGLGRARELRGVAQQVSSRPSPKPTGKTRLVE